MGSLPVEVASNVGIPVGILLGAGVGALVMRKPLSLVVVRIAVT